MRKLFFSVTAIAVLVICAGAFASVQWSADFETPPYVLAPIAGQQGWASSNPAQAVISDTSTPDGVQVLKVAGPGESGGAFGYPNASLDAVKLTALFNGPTDRASNPGIFLRQGSTYFVWAELVASYSYGYYNIYGDLGNQYAGDVSGRFRWDSGDWNKIEIWLDLANNQYACEVNDVLATHWYDNSGGLIRTGILTPFDNPVSALNTLQLQGNVRNNEGATPFLIDALVVEEGLPMIPEPATLSILGIALLFARRKKH
jgi:hypothetical protein